MIKAIVTDIEGTTSSLSFVKEVLFPYARQHMAEFVTQHGTDPRVAELIGDVSKQVGKPLSREQAIAQLMEWIDQDKKITPLKALQGLLWAHGYRNGDFTGHVYPDAEQQLRAWHARGIRLYVYSSGSVYAQKLLFGHTHYGDLNDLFDGYFDTNIGTKSDADSYRRICSELQLDAADILFLSDIEAELDAAYSAGMHTIWLVRDSEVRPATSHRQVRDFSAIEAP